jgi:hypothetical protein
MLKQNNKKKTKKQKKKEENYRGIRHIKKKKKLQRHKTKIINVSAISIAETK